MKEIRPNLVLENGSVNTVEKDRRWAALVKTGGYAEYSCWSQDELTPVGNDLDLSQLICLTLNYISAYTLITRVGKLSAGQRVLMHCAVGGMGTAMLDLFRMMGIKAFGTASQGMDEILGGIPIDYKSEDFVEVVNREGGVDLVVDHIGGSHLARSFKCLRPKGTLVNISSYAAVLGRVGMLETVGGLIRQRSLQGCDRGLIFLARGCDLHSRQAVRITSFQDTLYMDAVSSQYM